MSSWERSDCVGSRKNIFDLGEVDAGEEIEDRFRSWR